MSASVLLCDVAMMRTKNTATKDIAPARAPLRACAPALAKQHLRELADVHNDLLAALAQKQAATSTHDPDPIAVCRARWDLSRVNYRHQMVVNAILTVISPSASDNEASAIGRLRSGVVQQTQRFTRHVQSWTPHRIMNQWALFCAESAVVQADVKQQVREEQKLICRMLERRPATHTQRYDAL